jgi:hypothetical protein
MIHALFSLLQKKSKSSHDIALNYGITDTSYKIFSYQKWAIIVVMESQMQEKAEGATWNLTYTTLALDVGTHNLWYKKWIGKKPQLNLNKIYTSTQTLVQ